LNKLSGFHQDVQTIRVIQREIDIITAALLLTGQITILRMYVEPGGFGFTIGGPITRRVRLEGRGGNRAGNLIIDAIDFILAILIIYDLVGVTGIFITTGGFSLNITGPILGIARIEPTHAAMDKLLKEFDQWVSENFKVDTDLVTKLKRMDHHGINGFTYNNTR
jgi:hypothetical protein